MIDGDENVQWFLINIMRTCSINSDLGSDWYCILRFHFKITWYLYSLCLGMPGRGKGTRKVRKMCTSHNDQAGWRRRGHLRLEPSRFLSFQQFRFYRPFCFTCFHLLEFIVADYTGLHIVIHDHNFLPIAVVYLFFLEMLLYHITALTAPLSLFSANCYIRLDHFLLQMVIQTHRYNPPICLFVCCFANYLAASLPGHFRYFVRF